MLTDEEKQKIKDNAVSKHLLKSYNGYNVFGNYRKINGEKHLFYSWMILDSRIDKNRIHNIRKALSDKNLTDKSLRVYITILLTKIRYKAMLFDWKDLLNLEKNGYIETDTVVCEHDKRKFLLHVIRLLENDSESKREVCKLLAGQSYDIDDLVSELKKYPSDAVVEIVED